MSDINWMDEPEQAEDGNPALKEAREAARRNAQRARDAEESASRTSELERELAFTKAGVDTDTPAGRIFAKGYDGDLEVDAIKSAAAQMGLANAPAPEVVVPEEVPLDPSETELLNAPAGLSGNPPTADPPPADPYDAANGIFKQAVQDGEPTDTAWGYAFNSLVNAAQNGDKRVIIPQRSREALGG
jgi:hypothetical protein